MRSSSSLVLLLATLGSGLAACSDPAGNTNVTPADAGNTVDTGVATDRGNAADTGSAMDTGTATDTGAATDRPAVDTGPVDAGPPVDPCAAASVVDLNMAGMRTGATTRITRSNTTTARNGTLVATCAGNTVGQIAFRYTPTAAGRLSISTDNAGTTPVTFDTVVWAQNNCAPLAADGGTASGSLGCDDDSAPEPRGLTSRFTTTAAVAAGTPIFIVVAGYGAAMTSTGTFELSVTEVATVAVGGMCDSAGATSVCAMGSLCVAAAGTAMGTCVADGALNGACRATGAACDGAFVCSGLVTSTSSRCRTAVAAGAACDPTRVLNVCATGTNCITRNGASTCVAAGSLGGGCRTTEPRCEGALACSPSLVCRAIVAVDGACETNNATTVCASGGTCVATAPGAAMGTCRGAGTGAGTACRDTAPRCDGALACSTTTGSGVCRTIVAVGAACETAAVSTVCAMGGTCVATTAGAAMGTCRAAGTVAGAACREAAPRCDTGLDCSSMTGTGVCRRAVAAGAACAPGNISDVCAVGTACLPTSPTAGTCAMGRAETEPNNTPMTAQATITASAIFSGSATDTDTDCFHVTVPMGGAIFAESSLIASTACASGGPDPVIDIYDPANARIAGVDDTNGRGLCGTLNPTATMAARNLNAGVYTVCIEGFNDMPTNYLLTIGVYTSL